MFTLKQSGVACVSRLNKATRRADFRRGKRLGKGDHVVRWYKPNPLRAVDAATYKTLPDYIEIRETRVRVEQEGFRTKEIIVVTTLLDPEEATQEELARLYRRSVESRTRYPRYQDYTSNGHPALQDAGTCSQGNLDTHLAYNLIRTIMAQAAKEHGILAREISFKGTLQTLRSIPTATELSRAP